MPEVRERKNSDKIKGKSDKKRNRGNASHRETHFPAVVQFSPGVVDIKR